MRCAHLGGVAQLLSGQRYVQHAVSEKVGDAFGARETDSGDRHHGIAQPVVGPERSCRYCRRWTVANAELLHDESKQIAQSYGFFTRQVVRPPAVRRGRAQEQAIDDVRDVHAPICLVHVLTI